MEEMTMEMLVTSKALKMPLLLNKNTSSDFCGKQSHTEESANVIGFCPPMFFDAERWQKSEANTSKMRTCPSLVRLAHGR